MSTNVHHIDAHRFRSAAVTVLQCRADCEILTDQFAALLQSKNAFDAEELIFTALETMASTLEDLKLNWQDDDLKSVMADAPRLSCLAKGVGLLSVAKAAKNLAGAAQKDDAVALSATIERLDRCFDQAVSQVWQVFDRI